MFRRPKAILFNLRNEIAKRKGLSINDVYLKAEIVSEEKMNERLLDGELYFNDLYIKNASINLKQNILTYPTVSTIEDLPLKLKITTLSSNSLKNLEEK